MRINCDSCGQDISDPDFNGHFSIYCHKPQCAAHLAGALVEDLDKYRARIERAARLAELNDINMLYDHDRVEFSSVLARRRQWWSRELEKP